MTSLDELPDREFEDVEYSDLWGRLQRSSTLSEAVNCLPVFLRANYQTAILDLVDKAELAFKARSQADTTKTLKAKGLKIPAVGSIKPPSFQLSKEFEGSLQKATKDTMTELIAEYQDKAMDTYIELREMEYAYYDRKYLDPKKIKERMNDAHNIALQEYLNSKKVSSVHELENRAYAYIQAVEELNLEVALLCIQLVRKRFVLAEAKNDAKKGKVQAVDSTAVQTENPSSLSAESFRTMLSVEMKRKRQSERDKAVHKKVRTSYAFAPSIATKTYQKFSEKRKSSQKEEKRKEAEKIGEWSATLYKDQTPSLNRLRKDLAKLVIKGVFGPKSGAAFLKYNAPWWYVHTLRSFDFGVHKGPDVSLPDNINYTLSLNLKMIFPQRLKPHLPTLAWDNLVFRTRMWWQFRHKDNDGWTYYASLRIKNSTFKPEPACESLERALSKGRERLLVSYQDLVSPDKTQYQQERTMLPFLLAGNRELRRFMSESGFLAFITDKNLGIAVVSVEWYRLEVSRVLSQGYTKVKKVPWDHLRNKMDFLLRPTFVALTPQMFVFLDQPLDWSHVPHFHGIPKVHKEPWKLRPIVPMHSFITTNVGKILHVLLHPFKRCFPWICQSSRDFIISIRAFDEEKDKTRNWRLVSVDVNSMYTNILTSHLTFAIRRLLEGFVLENAPEVWTLDKSALIDWIIDAIVFLNDSVYFQFDGQIFKQDRGIAMGTAPGPTLADLFMAFYESTLNVQRVGFYTRYIDDVFMVTDWPEERLRSFLVVPGLTFTWEFGTSLPFLDVFLWQENMEVFWKPYVKRLNHYQYLPWSSSHPLAVKKGLVINELRRMAFLSKKPEFYEERKAFLTQKLRARGYPDTVLKSWTNAEWREGQFTPQERRPLAREPFLLAASEYNPVWDHVQLRSAWETVIETALKYQAEDGNLAQLLPSQVKKSLNRTYSLWDEVRRSNRDILGQLHTTTASQDLADRRRKS